MPNDSEHSSSNSTAEGKRRVPGSSFKGHLISGIVVTGNQLGRTLGFPTANIQTPQGQPLTVPNGVYLVAVILGNRSFFGLCNIGFRPTIGGLHLVTEVHILDFSEDIYGQEISVKIIRSIRKEKKFKSLEQLVNQIRLDKEKASKLISFFDKDQAR